MFEIKQEYKIVAFLMIIIVIVALIVLILTNNFGNVVDKFSKESKRKCISYSEEKHYKYNNIECTIFDDFDNSFVLRYPKFSEDNRHLLKFNSNFENRYNSIINNLLYSKEDNKFKLSSLNRIMDYKLYKYNDVFTIISYTYLVGNSNIKTDINYNITNIDIKSTRNLFNMDMWNLFKVDQTFLSNLKHTIRNLYFKEYKYIINNPNRKLINNKIDGIYDQININTIDNLYYDDMGNRKFIINMYNPKLDTNMPYYFTIMNNKTVKYSLFFE